MLAGHFGVAGIIKAVRPELPMGVLLVASQVPDLVFLPLNLAGVERLAPVPGADGYASALITAPFSHALVSNALFAAVAGVLVAVLARGRWGRGAGWIVAGTVFSHWLLDLIVHRPDIAVLPGGGAGLPLLGLGLWETPVAAAAVEGVLVLAGVVLYAWRTLRDQPNRIRARLYCSGITILLAGSFISDLLG